MKKSTFKKVSLLSLVLTGIAGMIAAFPLKNFKNEREIMANGQLIWDSMDCGVHGVTCEPGAIDPNCDYTMQDEDIMSYTTMFFCTSQAGFSSGPNNTGTYLWDDVFITAP